MNIDFKHIFTNMPIGTKLYSPICGECILERINTEGDIITSFTDEKGEKRHMTFNGNFGLVKDCNHGKVMIYPDEEMKWDYWQVKLFKKGDYVSNSKGFIAIFINKTECYSFKGEKKAFFDLTTFRYADKKEIELLNNSLMDEGFVWDGNNMAVIVDVPNFKIGEIIKVKNTGYFNSGKPLKIVDITKRKYVFEDGTTTSINKQGEYVHVGYSPIFAKGKLIRNKKSKEYFVIEDITERYYVLKGLKRQNLLFDFQNEWEMVLAEHPDYCSYANCNLLYENGFEFGPPFAACDLYDVYGFYSGDNHQVVFDDYVVDEKDVLRIPQDSAIKWIRNIYGVEIGTTPMVDAETNKTVYIPYARTRDNDGLTFVNRMGYQDVKEVESQSGAIDCAIRFVLTKLYK